MLIEAEERMMERMLGTYRIGREADDGAGGSSLEQHSKSHGRRGLEKLLLLWPLNPR